MTPESQLLLILNWFNLCTGLMALMALFIAIMILSKISSLVSLIDKNNTAMTNLAESIVKYVVEKERKEA